MFRWLFRLAMRLLGLAASTALLVMMLLTFADVVGRYAFHHSIFGTAEIVEYLMVITVFAGVALTTATNDHINISMFDNLFRGRRATVRRWSILLFSIFAYLLVTWELLEHALQLLGTDKRSTVLNQPLWVQPMGAAVLMIVGGVLLICGAVWSRGHIERLRGELFRSDGDAR